ncbi:MAG: chemotaxis protein CheX [Deltaproteobacteria bacterium]|nr:MAG: chemotaxis protein CheX [Deltaproteobacteria bacterium]
MKADYINPFIETLIYVISTTAQFEASLTRPLLKTSSFSRGPLSGIIELSGDVKGFVSITFSKEIILKIVSNMFGEEIDELNNDVKDAVGEIINMICGQATNKFVEKGFKISLESHGIKDGDEHFLPSLEDRPFMSIPLESENGELYIEVSLEN